MSGGFEGGGGVGGGAKANTVVVVRGVVLCAMRAALLCAVTVFKYSRMLDRDTLLLLSLGVMGWVCALIEGGNGDATSMALFNTVLPLAFVQLGLLGLSMKLQWYTPGYVLSIEMTTCSVTNCVGVVTTCVVVCALLSFLPRLSLWHRSVL